MQPFAELNSLASSTLEHRWDSARPIDTEGSEIDGGHPELIGVSGVTAPQEGSQKKGREMQMDTDQIGVRDVGLDDEPPPEGEGAVEEDAGPQWLRVLLWNNPKVWLRCPAEQQPEGALWVGAGRKPRDGEPTVEVVDDICGKPKWERIRSPAEYRARGLPPPLITVSDVALMLGVGRATVERLPAAELPYVHVGRGTNNLRRRYRREDVLAFIEAQCARSAEREDHKMEMKEWERAVSCAKRAGGTGTSASTTRARARSTESQPTQPTKPSLVNAWRKLRG